MIDTDLGHPYYVTAADEVLAISCGNDEGPNTLHFYRREPPAVSVGYFRNVSEDVDVDSCEELGVLVVRRTSAGGSIYTDKDQLIFSVISKQALGKDIQNTFYEICHCLIDALGTFGINAKFKPPNDVLINGKKVSGSAQAKKKNVYIVHCTVILGLNNETMDRVLKNPKPGYTSSIETESGFKPDINDLKIAIKRAVQKRIKMAINEGSFTKYENKTIHELVENKYSTESWNFKR